MQYVPFNSNYRKNSSLQRLLRTTSANSQI